MKEKLNNKVLRGAVGILNRFAISQVNSACHYIYYQEEESSNLNKYKKIKDNKKIK